jgi:phosphoribosylformylglycinamidine cyclo-ligase
MGRNESRGTYTPSKPFNERIRELIATTHPKEGPILVRRMGKRFEISIDPEYLRGFSEMCCSDGIGTKGSLHWRMGTLRNGVQDAFAMVVDDLIEGGFIPVLLQNHIQIQEEDDEKILSLIDALVGLSKENRWEYAEKKSNPIIISGGETAITNTIDGFEMGITATGYVRKGEEIFPNAKPRDVIIGLRSGGIHSNGLSFYRDELLNKRHMRLSDELPWGAILGEELTKPTSIYLPAIKELIGKLPNNDDIAANDLIHGMVHITGGGISKLRELISNKKADIEVHRSHRLIPQEIFRYAHDELGVTSEEMYERFNNGIGYVIAIEPSSSKRALAILRTHFDAEEIGRAKEGTGRVIVESQYEPVNVEYR